MHITSTIIPLASHFINLKIMISKNTTYLFFQIWSSVTKTFDCKESFCQNSIIFYKPQDISHLFLFKYFLCFINKNTKVFFSNFFTNHLTYSIDHNIQISFWNFEAMYWSFFGAFSSTISLIYVFIFTKAFTNPIKFSRFDEDGLIMTFKCTTLKC